MPTRSPFAVERATTPTPVSQLAMSARTRLAARAREISGDAPSCPFFVTPTPVAGLVLVALGRIPERPGDQVHLGEWTIEVTGVNHHAITAVRLCPTNTTTDKR
jgi:CBS domain containing-hemolysin-like protein